MRHLAASMPTDTLQPRLRGCLRALVLASLAALPAVGAQADTGTGSGGGSPNSTASARLSFAINIDKFVYLRVGNAGDANINSVGFTLTPSIPATPTTPTAGNNRAVSWSGAAPTVSVAASGNVLPVEVRSNGGTVTLRATTSAALTSGSATIPMSQITLGSSDGALPAPPLADTGTGASTTVTGTAFGNRVTSRTANWTFSYAPTPAQMPRAGSYTGQVTFTASIP